MLTHRHLVVTAERVLVVMTLTTNAHEM